jgi:hypothetical protein
MIIVITTTMIMITIMGTITITTEKENVLMPRKLEKPEK